MMLPRMKEYKKLNRRWKQAGSETAGTLPAPYLSRPAHARLDHETLP